MSAVLLSRCEAGEGNCPAEGTWLVRAGTRKGDARLSCAQHLNRTAVAMLSAEGRPGASLVVTPTRRMLAQLGLEQEKEQR